MNRLPNSGVPFVGAIAAWQSGLVQLLMAGPIEASTPTATMKALEEDSHGEDRPATTSTAARPETGN